MPASNSSCYWLQPIFFKKKFHIAISITRTVSHFYTGLSGQSLQFCSPKLRYMKEGLAMDLGCEPSFCPIKIRGGNFDFWRVRITWRRHMQPLAKLFAAPPNSLHKLLHTQTKDASYATAPKTPSVPHCIIGYFCLRKPKVPI